MEKIDVFNYKKYRDGAENDVNARVSHVNYVIQGFNDANDLGYYILDMLGIPQVDVSTTKGIIEVKGMGGMGPTPAPGFSGSATFSINNPSLDLTLANRDNVYVQYSVYYSPILDDLAVPYLVSSGYALTGLQFTLYNANPALAGTGQWKGAFYIYYELYTKN